MAEGRWGLEPTQSQCADEVDSGVSEVLWVYRDVVLLGHVEQLPTKVPGSGEDLNVTVRGRSELTANLVRPTPRACPEMCGQNRRIRCDNLKRVNSSV